VAAKVGVNGKIFRPYLVLEFCLHGSLDQFLKAREFIELSEVAF
jgi:hypothetical protein